VAPPLLIYPTCHTIIGHLESPIWQQYIRSYFSDASRAAGPHRAQCCLTWRQYSIIVHLESPIWQQYIRSYFSDASRAAGPHRAQCCMTWRQDSITLARHAGHTPDQNRHVHSHSELYKYFLHGCMGHVQVTALDAMWCIKERQ
jgi:hypothetical protein